VPGTWAEHSICGWTEGKKRPRPPVGMTRIRDRGHVQCAQLKFYTPGLPNYEGVSIALAFSCYGAIIDGLGLRNVCFRG